MRNRYREYKQVAMIIEAATQGMVDAIPKLNTPYYQAALRLGMYQQIGLDCPLIDWMEVVTEELPMGWE